MGELGQLAMSLYSVTSFSVYSHSPPVSTMVVGPVWMEQWLNVSCRRVKSSLASPPSQGRSSVVSGEEWPPIRRRPWLVTAEVWYFL